MRRWVGASFALALLCVFVSSPILAQDSAASKPAKSSEKASSTKAKSAASVHAKASSKSSGTKSAGATKSAAATKSHAASHPSTGARAKSNTTAAARGSKSKYASRKNGKTKTVARGQQKIAPERAEEIQEALVREHYLSEAAGSWNQASEDAMRRYQADHGWQSKTVPDARALIALGLGPSHDHLLNPESAMTTGPEAPRAAAITPASQSPAPGAPMNPNSTTPGTSVQRDSGSPQ